MAQMQGDSADLLRVFIDQAPAPIAMFDMEMRYIAASRRWVSDYHLEKREWRGASHYEVFTDLPDRWRGIHRRGLEESMSFEVARAHRRHSSLGVLMLDMDRFKELNDNFGHLAGDSLLRAVAQALLSNIRAGDVACRFGGDEFIVLMPGADLDDVTRRGHQLCTLLNSLSLEYEHVQLPHPGCSMGVAVYPGNGVTGAELLRSVDLSLYRDKVHGHH